MVPTDAPTKPQITQAKGKASFGISLVVIFTYYIVLVVARTLGDTGVLSPFLAGWLPNLIGLGAGMFLLGQISKR